MDGFVNGCGENGGSCGENGSLFLLDAIGRSIFNRAGAMEGRRESTEQTEITEQTEKGKPMIFSVCSFISVCSILSSLRTLT